MSTVYFDSDGMEYDNSDDHNNAHGDYRQNLQHVEHDADSVSMMTPPMKADVII